jgi:hypothetical protein
MTFAMHEEALTERGKVLFPRLSRFDDFYLVGGTALALQIGHRQSVDFDLFTTQALPSHLLEKVKRTFPDCTVVTTYRTNDQLNVLLDNVKTTFFSYKYPVIDPFVSWQEVSLASVLEIAAMKAFSIGKRLSYKDYVDWYFLLLEEHVNLPEVIALAKKKFGHDFNDSLFLGQLVSFEDIQETPINFLREQVSRSTIEDFLRNYVQQLL